MRDRRSGRGGVRRIGRRTVIGIVCLAAAALVFLLAPRPGGRGDGRRTVARAVRFVEAGAVIGADDVAEAEVGAYNLPEGLAERAADVVGRRARCDLYAGDLILEGKLTDSGRSARELLGGLGGGRKAISVTVPSFGSALSGMLRTGDIVSLIVCDAEGTRAFTPRELQYVLVITATSLLGEDLGDGAGGAQPATITLLAGPEQAELLALYDRTGSLHAALEYRGDAETAARYLAAQDQALKGGG